MSKKQMATIISEGYFYSHRIGQVVGKTYIDGKVSGVKVLFLFDVVEVTFPEGDIVYLQTANN